MTYSDKFAVVFSGGGALGSWEIGCYEAIIDHHGRDPFLVTGASAGALNAAAITAKRSMPELKKFWTDLKPENVYLLNEKLEMGLWDLFKKRVAAKSTLQVLREIAEGVKSIYNTEPLKQYLESIFQKDPTFFTSHINCVISSTDLNTRKRVLFHSGAAPEHDKRNPNDDWQKMSNSKILVQALMGTSALPVMFPPFEGFVDGGVLHNQPISPAVQLESSMIYVIMPGVSAIGSTKDLISIADNLCNTWLSVSLLAQVEKLALINKVKVQNGKLPIPLCIIRPYDDLTEAFDVNLLSFGKNVDQLINDGYKVATKRLKAFDTTNDETWYDDIVDQRLLSSKKQEATC